MFELIRKYISSYSIREELLVFVVLFVFALMLLNKKIRRVFYVQFVIFGTIFTLLLLNHFNLITLNSEITHIFKLPFLSALSIFSSISAFINHLNLVLIDKNNIQIYFIAFIAIISVGLFTTALLFNKNVVILLKKEIKTNNNDGYVFSLSSNNNINNNVPLSIGTSLLRI